MMHPRKAHSGTPIPKPLSDMMLTVLRFGAVSSGMAGIDWQVNGQPCSSAVRGVRVRGLVTTQRVRIGERSRLMTVRTPAGNEALAEAERQK